ncbi:MAG TPA: hypothetical protein DCP28_10360, partial [Cytophagales bacterium]|nr:hypothetical protein [Cytophagales bacterium]
MISFYPYRIYLRRALVLSLLLTLALPLLGQQKYQREIDSLEASLTQTLTDSARLKTTFELVKFYFLRGDIPRSLEYNQEAYTQSIALESSVDEADALERFGWLYSKNASYDQSIDYYQQAMVLRERLDQPRMVMFNLNAMATVYKTLSQYGEAQRMYQEVQAWGKKTADSVYWGVGLQNEASVLSTQSKYHRAIPLLRQAEALMKPIDYWHGLKYVYDNLGIAYRALGQHEEALRWYRLNEQYLLNEDEPRALARAQNNMAHLYHDRQQYDSARYYVEQAYRLRLEVKDEAGLGYSGNLLGRILTDLQKFEEARPYLEESLRIRAKREDYSLLSRTYRYLGNWYARQGDFDSALIQFDQATHYANLITDTAQQNINLRDLGDFYLQEGVYPQALEAFLTLLANEQSRSNVFFVGMAYGRLGEVLAKQEEYRDAIVYYDNAILTHQSIENRWGEADSYLALGGLYQALDQPEESIANYEKSLALRTQEGLGREAEVWQGMGEAYVAMGQLAEGRAYLQRARAQHIREQNPQGLAATYLTLARLRQMEQAITPAIGLARQGLAQAQVSRQKDLIRDAHGLLADLYREQQAFQSAYFHKSRFQEIQDSLFNEANVRQLAQLELGFAFEQEKKDLAEAQAREELQLQAEIDRRRTVQWATLGGVA